MTPAMLSASRATASTGPISIPGATATEPAPFSTRSAVPFRQFSPSALSIREGKRHPH